MINVRALLKVEIGNTGFRQYPTAKLEGYMIDTALDTDSDAFSIDVGAPNGELNSLLDRNNEVQVNIFTQFHRQNEIQPLTVGLADVVSYNSDDFVLSIQGRDLSSVATDSDAPPGEVKGLRPHVYVEKEARALGIGRTRLAHVTSIPKFYRDGSETYWESWYRMYRKRKMWLWFDPDGTLIADKLHYATAPSYFFGAPSPGQSGGGWIPVERMEITKDNTNRVGEVWVFGERGDIGFVAQVPDRSIARWKKKPLKIQTSQVATSRNEAREEAEEEIFESQVGALEITLTTAYSGSVIRQNNMAQVSIPEAGINGLFFVVGVRLAGGQGGFVQTIRLREKNYAISRRVPADPKLEDEEDTGNVSGAGTGVLRGAGVPWPATFLTAAREFHDGWDLALFLGVLLAICDKESGFRNVREGNSDVEWYPKPAGGVGAEGGRTAYDQWRRDFANSAGNPLNPFGREAGVGPMQLTTVGYKVWADEYGAKRDEYEGGRWIPQANVRAGARAFASKLVGLDPDKPSNIWEGVYRYNGGGSAAIAYRDDVKRRYESTWRGKAEGAVEAGETIPVGSTTNVTVKNPAGGNFTVRVSVQAPDIVKKAINYAIRQLGKPYEWGAEGPNSFDCSGLVYAAFNYGGYDAGRTDTFHYFKMGTAVTKDNLRSGDLVFFSDLNHMGIYLNDEHFIHAPKTGDVVKISPTNSPWYLGRWEGARRLVAWPAIKKLPSET